jgi:hypothetical protein
MDMALCDGRSNDRCTCRRRADTHLRLHTRFNVERINVRIV